MTAVDVRRCTVRVVRHGGWSWGADPRRLRDDVLAAVPAAIARALQDAVPAWAYGEIRDPVRVTVRVGGRELARLAGGPGPPVAPSLAPALAPELARILQRAIREAGIEPARPSAPDRDELRAAATARPPGPVVLRLLLSWERHGVLADLLGRLPGPVLAGWMEALTQGWRHRPGPRTGTADEPAVPEALPGWVARLADGTPEGRLRARLAAAALISGRTGLLPGHPSVDAALAALPGAAPEQIGAVPEGGLGPGVREPRVDTSPSSSGASAPAAAPRDRRAPSPQDADPDASPGDATGPRPDRRPVRSRPETGCALPFLALLQLSRIGWVDTLAAGVAATGLDAHWPSLAGGLACSVLGERDPVSAAVFAGVTAPFAELPLPDRAGRLAPPLDAVLGRNLLDGHQGGQPLVQVAAGPGARGVVLLDGQGLFPIAWADDPAGLESWLRECSGSPLISVPPGDDRLAARAAKEVAAMTRRRALPPAADPAVERSFALAGATALASISWTLWGAAEPTGPSLAIERLASLTAVVQHESDRVRVVLPLGGRYFDLERHGLVGAVPAVPWLDDRPVEIVGG